MSGGSYNYLYSKSIEEIVSGGSEAIDEVLRMGLEVSKVPNCELAAIDTARFHTLLEQIQELMSKAQKEINALSPVWKAQEWWTSNDWPMADVEQAGLDYKVKKVIKS